MSLARIALRTAAVEALKGQTLVGDRVLDSPNGAIDVAADGSFRTDEDRPFISVYTDVGKVENVTGRSLTENGLCDIVFEMAVSMAMLETNKQTGVTTMIGIAIPASDRAFEFQLDIVQRQIFDALNDPDNVWANIYRGLQGRVRKIEFAGARNTEDGQRLAGHQIRLTVELIDDPVKGEALDPNCAFLRLLDAMEASGDAIYLEQAQKMRSLISGTNEPWETLQRRHGMTADELLALGHGPLAQDEDRATPEMGPGTIEVDGSDPVTVTDQ